VNQETKTHSTNSVSSTCQNCPDFCPRLRGNRDREIVDPRFCC